MRRHAHAHMFGFGLYVVPPRFRRAMPDVVRRYYCLFYVEHCKVEEISKPMPNLLKRGVRLDGFRE